MRHRSKLSLGIFGMVATLALAAQFVAAQGRPHVTAVDPQAGKVNDSLTLMGENLGKEGVSAVFLSDDTNDHKATVVEQVGEKIVIKVPQVKAGSYNVSIQVGDAILVLPLKFSVQE